MNSNLCRICLQSIESNLFPLYFQIGDKPLSEMVMFLTGIEISDIFYQNVTFPQNICQTCVDELTAACRIKQTCINSDKILRSKTKNEPSQKDEHHLLIVKQEIDTSEVKWIDPVGDTLPEHMMPLVKFKVEADDVLDGIDMLQHNLLDGVVEASLTEEPTSRGAKKHKRKVEFSPSSVAKPIFKCYICRQQFEKSKLKEDHLKECHVGERICSICDYMALTNKGLDVHLMLHEKPELLSYMCEICSRLFRLNSQLQHHIKQTHCSRDKRPQYQCDLCGLIMIQKASLLRHMKTVHLNMRPHRCVECSIDFTTRISLDHHKIAHHNLRTKYSCNNCNQMFPALSMLRYHFKKCAGAPSKKKIYRRTHVARDLPLSMERDDTGHIRCKVCREIFESPILCSKHFAIHAKFPSCIDCDAKFPNSSNLIRHIDIVHRKTHNFQCSFCSKTFGQKTQLDSHVNTHTGAKPFSCELCSFRTGDLAAISKHRKKCPSRRE